MYVYIAYTFSDRELQTDRPAVLDSEDLRNSEVLQERDFHTDSDLQALEKHPGDQELELPPKKDWNSDDEPPSYDNIKLSIMEAEHIAEEINPEELDNAPIATGSHIVDDPDLQALEKHPGDQELELSPKKDWNSDHEPPAYDTIKLSIMEAEYIAEEIKPEDLDNVPIATGSHIVDDGYYKATSLYLTTAENEYSDSNLDTSFNDPDYVESDCSESSEDEIRVRHLNEMEVINSESQKTTGYAKSKNYVSDSAASDSDESLIIPNISNFFVGDNIVEKKETSSICLLRKKEKKSGCKKIYDKINHCLYCSKPIHSKISRHLLTVHKNESRVYEILTLPKRSALRMMKLELLANEGNFKHNVQVLREKKGTLAVGRRESRDRKFKIGNYLPCIFCKKFLLKETLWLHHRKCSVRKLNDLNGNMDESSNNAVRLSRQFLNGAVTDGSEPGVSVLLARMQNDEITEHVKGDSLIRRYAALKVESLGRVEDQKISDMHRVSQPCRTLARLVIKCREENDAIIGLNQLITPQTFDLVVKSTKSLCLDNEKAAPSLGKLMGNTLVHIIQVKKGVSLRKGNEKSLQDAEDFQKLFSSEWNYRVNSVLQKMTNTINRQKVRTIPLTEDLQKINQHIDSGMKEASSSLKCFPTQESWKRLAKLTLCRLILFNKRRRAEVRDLILKDYINRPDWKKEQQGEFKMALSLSDRMMAER